MQPIGNTQQLSRTVRGRRCSRQSADAQIGGGVPNLDYPDALLRNGGGNHWASIMTPRILRHAFQTHVQCPGTELHWCEIVSSRFRALDGTSTRQFRSHSHLLLVDVMSYLVRSIVRITIYCEPESQCLYCNLGRGKKAVWIMHRTRTSFGELEPSPYQHLYTSPNPPPATY